MLHCLQHFRKLWGVRAEWVVSSDLSLFVCYYYSLCGEYLTGDPWNPPLPTTGREWVSHLEASLCLCVVPVGIFLGGKLSLDSQKGTYIKKKKVRNY